MGILIYYEVFCHKNGTEDCGTGKPENLLYFSNKNQSELNKLVCNREDNNGSSLKQYYICNVSYPPTIIFLLDIAY